MDERRARRRRFVNTLIAVNGIGFVGVGTLLGGAMKSGPVPWYGLASVALMFLGIVVPFYREFVAIRDGFAEVEREAMRGIKRRRGDTGYQEVIGGPEHRPFERVRNQPLIAVLITAAAWTLAVIEAVRQWSAG